jgi:(p)ppGpp synthase/HD superfamily hydrolase
MTGLSPRYVRAVALAHELHDGQTRTGSEVPYLAHLLGVSAVVLEYRGGEDEAIAGLLHDGPEDQGGRATLERIRAEFGADVARIVEALTDSYDGEDKPSWRERKEGYLVRLRDEPEDVLRVSLADKLSNARSLLREYRIAGAAIWGRFGDKDCATQLWYFRELRAVFEARYPGVMTEEFSRTVAEFEAAVSC